jgi:phage terminase small subunit
VSRWEKRGPGRKTRFFHFGGEIMADNLTVKQEKFVQGLFAGLSQREAYKQAFDCANMKAETIDVKACNLAKMDKVRARLEKLQNEYKERNMVTKERVLQEYARLGFFDPRKLFNDDGSPKGIHELDDDTAAVLAGLEVMEVYEGYGENREFVGYLKKYKLANKLGALDSIARHLGMFNDKVTVTIDKKLEDFV